MTGSYRPETWTMTCTSCRGHTVVPDAEAIVFRCHGRIIVAFTCRACGSRETYEPSARALAVLAASEIVLPDCTPTIGGQLIEAPALTDDDVIAFGLAMEQETS